MASYFISIRYRDSRAFLSAMLEREEPEEREARNIDSLSVDPEDCAFLIQVLHSIRIVPRTQKTIFIIFDRTYEYRYIPSPSY